MCNTMEKGNKQNEHIDRSKIRILLCDIDPESCQEILTLLCKFSYQVEAVWMDRQVFDTLNSEGPNTDIILADVGLLMANDALLLRHIMHEKQLQQIPVIIITTGNEIRATVKGLKLGAADYLVKPMHDDELLNLWRHSEK